MLTNVCKTVSPTHRPRSTAHKHSFSASDTHFCYKLSKSQGIVQEEGIGKLKKFIHLIGSRTPDLPPVAIVPSPLRYRAPRATAAVLSNILSSARQSRTDSTEVGLQSRTALYSFVVAYSLSRSYNDLQLQFGPDNGGSTFMYVLQAC
jgi:hypothetical protein